MSIIQKDRIELLHCYVCEKIRASDAISQKDRIYIIAPTSELVFDTKYSAKKKINPCRIYKILYLKKIYKLKKNIILLFSFFPLSYYVWCFILEKLILKIMLKKNTLNIIKNNYTVALKIICTPISTAGYLENTKLDLDIYKSNKNGFIPFEDMFLTNLSSLYKIVQNPFFLCVDTNTIACLLEDTTFIQESYLNTETIGSDIKKIIINTNSELNKKIFHII